MTGGSSVGTADLTAKVINDAGQPGVLVHGVSIKPGKPLVVGLVGAPSRHVPVFGLPGHPAAVSICFDLFVKPVLARLTGETPHPALEGISPYRVVKARLARSISSSPGREDHVRVALEKRDDGLWARPIFGASGLISTLVKAVGTVVVPVTRSGSRQGKRWSVILAESRFGQSGREGDSALEEDSLDAIISAGKEMGSIPWVIAEAN